MFAPPRSLITPTLDQSILVDAEKRSNNVVKVARDLSQALQGLITLVPSDVECIWKAVAALTKLWKSQNPLSHLVLFFPLLAHFRFKIGQKTRSW